MIDTWLVVWKQLWSTIIKKINWLVVSTYPCEKWWSESQLGWLDIPNMMQKS